MSAGVAWIERGSRCRGATFVFLLLLLLLLL